MEIEESEFSLKMVIRRSHINPETRDRSAMLYVRRYTVKSPLANKEV